MSAGQISRTGISIIYEPPHEEPAVDIVLVHGLQGHPYNTWAAKCPGGIEEDYQPTVPSSSKREILHSFSLLRWKSKSSAASKAEKASSLPSDKNEKNLAKDGASDTRDTVYWPRDFLPLECPRARIIVWGYDTKVTKLIVKSVNKTSLFSHAKDLMYALSRERPVGRRTIFVAHSLGGIVVKEMLCNSSTSVDPLHNDIIKSTGAVLFMGTPHRGSQQLAAVGEVVRKVAAHALMMDTSSVLLDVLGLKSSDLERCQESFSRLWSAHDFRVKTFQEGLGLTGVNLGLLNEKVVPDSSSLLGDFREQAEYLQANHMDMCRYARPNDPNYRIVAGELRKIYKAIQVADTASTEDQKLPKDSYSLTATAMQDKLLFELIDTLRFTQMGARAAVIRSPVENSCRWLLEHEHYRRWLTRSHVAEYGGLLRLKGNPGSGKSTIMKMTFNTVTKDLSTPGVAITSFFFNAKGSELEKTPLGFYRSVVYQLLKSATPAQLHVFAASQQDKFVKLQNEEEIDWGEDELKLCFENLVLDTTATRVIVFADALDECVEGERELTYFFREITQRAFRSGTALDICFSSRFYPIVALDKCPDIFMEDCNQTDIESYVRQRMELADGVTAQEDITLVEQIVRKASGNFLWVVLVVRMLLKDRDEGKTFLQLQRRLKRVPGTLHDLYVELLTQSRTSDDARKVVHIFQWVTLSMQPLRLREWHQIFALLGDKSLESLSQWRESADYVGDQTRLEKRIRTLSCGLVEIRGGPDFLGRIVEEDDSNFAYAGSLDPDHGETRFVQLIHESVRHFFLYDGGFSVLDSSLATPIGSGHISIMNMCLDYLGISELDGLVEARLRLAAAHANKPSRQDLSDPRPLLPSSIAPPAGPPNIGRQIKRRASDGSIGSFASAGSSDYRGFRLSPKNSLRGSDNADFDGEWDQFSKYEYVPWRLPSESSGSSRSSSEIFQSKHPAQDPNHLSEEQASTDAETRTREADESAKFGDTGEQTASLPPDSSFVEPAYLCLDPILSDSNSDIDAPLSSEQVPLPEDRNMIPELDEEYDLMNTPEGSLVGGSKVLQVGTAMLYYASMMLFYHAEDAQDWGADPTDVVLRLMGSQTSGWQRWLSLREDISPLTRLEEHCIALNLTSWIEPILDYHLASPDSDYLGIAGDCFFLAEDMSNATISSKVIKHQTKVFFQYQKLLRDGNILIKDWNILHYLASTERIDLVLAYKNRFASVQASGLAELVNTTDSNKLTPLLTASARQSALMVKALLDLGADPNVADPSSGLSPLHNACRAQPFDLETIRVLIRKGALVTAVDRNGKTPMSCLEVNSSRGEYEVLLAIDVLVRAGAEPNDILGDQGRTPLHLASLCGLKELVTLLIQAGAKCDAPDSQHATPLHLLCSQSDEAKVVNMADKLECIEILLRAGANPNQMTRSLETAVDLAEKVEFHDAVELIRSYQRNEFRQARIVVSSESTKFTSEAEFRAFL